uniref:Uncharacterized protein LOC114338373 n=1 Tax=Diabrotica virgifera virgifera TaxID=50390 RepID=A0A6P7GEL3_DIAVI
MKPYKAQAILEARCKLEEKFASVYEHFSPNYKKSTITAKFYSKYEGFTAYEARPDILRDLIRANDYPPNKKLIWPETVNQWYGWFTEPLTNADQSDTRNYNLRIYTEITKHGMKLLENRSKTKKK